MVRGLMLSVFLGIGLSGLACMARAADVPPPGISGRDDRSPDLGVLSTYRDGVGRLLVPVDRRELRECTAFCVDRRWIMTAAHCLAGLSRVPRQARFVPDAEEGGRQGVAIAWPRREPEAWNAAIGGVAFPVAANRRSIRPEQDWVALPLSAPVCRTTLPVLPVRARHLIHMARKGKGADKGRRVELSVLAHHGDVGHARLLRSARCGLAINRDARRLRRRLPPEVILHDCDLAFGASGSPLFLRVPYDRHVVVGMNVAIFERNRARIGRLAHGPLGGPKGGAAGTQPAQGAVDDGFVANMAVSASTFAAVVMALRQEGPPVTDRRAIASLQRLLRAKGLDPGPIDGVMGPRTREALIAFRRSQGMEPVALASSVILEVLRDTTEVTTAAAQPTGERGGLPPRPGLVPAASRIRAR